MLQSDLNYPLGNCVLLWDVDRKKMLVVNRPNSLKVCLPGGKQERGEEALAGAIRELREEAGVVLLRQEWTPLYVGVCQTNRSDAAPPGIDYWVTTYLGLVDSSKVICEDREGLSPRWMCIDEFLSQSDFPAYNALVIEALYRVLGFKWGS